MRRRTKSQYYQSLPMLSCQAETTAVDAGTPLADVPMKGFAGSEDARGTIRGLLLAGRRQISLTPVETLGVGGRCRSRLPCPPLAGHLQPSAF